MCTSLKISKYGVLLLTIAKNGDKMFTVVTPQIKNTTKEKKSQYFVALFEKANKLTAACVDMKKAGATIGRPHNLFIDFFL